MGRLDCIMPPSDANPDLTFVLCLKGAAVEPENQPSHREKKNNGKRNSWFNTTASLRTEHFVPFISSMFTKNILLFCFI